MGLDPPVRFRRATAAPCVPSEALVVFGRFASERFSLAPAWAFWIFRLAAALCFSVTMSTQYLLPV
jgi:hypothetical protein